MLQRPPRSSRTYTLLPETTHFRSAVGVAVIEVEKCSVGTCSAKAGSKYNKRHTGNDTYRVGGPASGILPSTSKGTLNNCSSGRTPWGTYLTCEDTTENYLDLRKPEEAYGWTIAIDPYGELAKPTTRTTMGRKRMCEA